VSREAAVVLPPSGPGQAVSRCQVAARWAGQVGDDLAEFWQESDTLHMLPYVTAKASDARRARPRATDRYASRRTQLATPRSPGLIHGIPGP
jgi:hypothetical protein